MTLPIDRTALIAATTNQVPNSIIRSAQNIAAITAPYNAIDELYGYVNSTLAGIYDLNKYGRLGIINVLDAPYNAVGDGVTDDTAAITSANNTGKEIVFPAGTYLIQSSITFNHPVHLMYGAVLKVRSAAVVTFNKGIEAGWYTIIDTEDDFITDLTIDSSVIVKGCRVKADWFCAKVVDVELIKTISDQTNNLTKAFRAAAGDFVLVGSDYETSISSGVVELGVGYYRVDKTFALSTIVSSTVYYRVDGFRFTGQGDGSSYLVRTDMTSLDYVFLAIYTGELTNLDNFKITCFNPDGGTSEEKFSSASMALMFLQGDSLQLSNVWVSGAQTAVVDSNGVSRNGVGFQFSSCVDTYFTNIFVENCTTGVAFGSATVSGTNLEIYSTREQAIGLGVFVADWPDFQETSSIVNIGNIQANACKRGMTVIEEGETGQIAISNSYFDGYMSELELNPGILFVWMTAGTSLVGGIVSTVIKNFWDKAFSLSANCSLGRTDIPFFMTGCTVTGQTYDVAGGVFCMGASGTYANLICSGLGITDIFGVLLDAPANGNLYFENVTLSRYTGRFDVSSNRQLFISNGIADIDIRKVKRNNADTVALTQFAFAAGGNIYIDIDSLYNATRAISGSATVTMPSKEAFA